MLNRRNFLSKSAVAAGGAATIMATPAASNLISIPREIIRGEGMKQGSKDEVTLKIQLIELVGTRRKPMKDHATLDLVLRGNVAQAYRSHHLPRP